MGKENDSHTAASKNSDGIKFIYTFVSEDGRVSVRGFEVALYFEFEPYE